MTFNTYGMDWVAFHFGSVTSNKHMFDKHIACQCIIPDSNDLGGHNMDWKKYILWFAQKHIGFRYSVNIPKI